MRPFAAALLVAIALVQASVPQAAFAQDLELRAAQAPYYAGIPIELQISARGFEEEPRPEVSAETPPGTTIEVVGISPKVSTYMELVNGHVSRTKQVEFVYRLQFLGQKPGRYRIGPFHVKQGALERKTGIFEVTLGSIPLAGNQRIRLVLPEGPVYVGQRVPVKIEWWTELGAADLLVSQRAVVPLFDRIDAFTFVDNPVANAKFNVAVELKTGLKELPAVARNERAGDQTFVVRSAERTMVPLEAGAFTFEPATLTVEEAIAWRRDFFGMRTPTQTRTLRAADQTRTIEISRLPVEGRPASFAGAVGSGFNLQARADRTVVQAGDPITLTLTLRGDGGLETASLPILTDAGLDADRFRVPHTKLTGRYEGGSKQFEVGVRVLDPSVREIPPITYSWFDPAKGEYQTARSEPIALSVREAKIVSAADVFSSAEKVADGEEEVQPPADGDAGFASTRAASTNPGAANGTTTSGRQVGLVLTGADLSVEIAPDRMFARRSGFLWSTTFRALVYATGLLMLGGAAVVRRRADQDPLQRRRRVELAALRARLEHAGGAEEVAEVLRSLRWLAGDVDGAEVDGLVAELEEVVYRPGGQCAPAAPALIARARDLASRVTVCLILVCAALQAVPTSVAAADDDSIAVTASANQAALNAYAQAQNQSERRARLAGFAKAYALFSSAVAQTGTPGADLFANQGNAALQAERLGYAVLAFRRALNVDPSNQRAQKNLVYVRGLLPPWVPRPHDEGLLDSFLSWPRHVAPATLQGVAALLFAFACFIAAIGVARARTGVIVTAALPVIVWAFLAVSPRLAWWESPGQEAVVVVDGALGRASDSAHAPARFREPLPAGTELTVTERRPGWVRVVLASGRDAWLSEGSVEPVVSD